MPNIIEQLKRLDGQEEQAMGILATAIEQQELRLQDYRRDHHAPDYCSDADPVYGQLKQQLQALEDQRETVHDAFRRRHLRIAHQLAGSSEMVRLQPRLGSK